MKKVFAAAFSLLILLVSNVGATTVILSPAGVSRNVVTSSGSIAPAGSLIVVGTFTDSAAFTYNASLSAAANYAAAMTAGGGGWEEFGVDTTTGVANAGVSSTLALTTVSGNSKAGGQITDNLNGSTKATFFDGDPVYIWIFNGTTIANSTQVGVFRDAAATVPWTFPTNTGGSSDSVSLSTSPGGAPTLAAVGGAGSVSSTQIILAAAGVPEPSHSILALLGVSALAFRRRRVA